jgi:cell division protease FtsH
MASYIRHRGFGERISHVDVSTQADEGINTDVASTNAEIEAGLVTQYQRARLVLEDNQGVFLKMVNALMDAGELASEQISQWVGIAEAPRRDVLEPYEAKLKAFVHRSAANRKSVRHRA